MLSTKRRLVIVLPPMLTVPSCPLSASVIINILSRNMLKRVGRNTDPQRTSSTGCVSIEDNCTDGSVIGPIIVQRRRSVWRW